jgi:hypothetical protein
LAIEEPHCTIEKKPSFIDCSINNTAKTKKSEARVHALQYMAAGGFNQATFTCSPTRRRFHHP